MNKIKVMTVVGTRPEIIRLSATINKLEQLEAVRHILVHTGQNYDYELNEIFFEDLNIKKPDYFLNAAVGNAMNTISNILIEIDKVLEVEKPDAFLILGDTNSCLSAIAAKRRKIPVFHMEAGNRCFDERVPEEANRRIVDHISDINLPYSSIGREHLISEGIKSDRIIKTGSPIFEVLHNMKEKIDNSKILETLKLKKDEYFVVSAHREENVDTNNLLKLIDSLNALAKKYKKPIIFSVHPRTRKQIEKRDLKLNDLILPLKPLGFVDYNKLQKEALVVLSDSGTISEESAILKFKALNLRETHERPEAMEEAAVIMVGVNQERILQALQIVLRQTAETIDEVADYMVNNVSEKVIRIILSYIDYINVNVWKK